MHTAGAPQTLEFDGGFELVGVGTQAIYAVVTTLTTTTSGTTSAQRLIAIVGNQALPANVSGFPGLAVTSSHVRLGGGDTLSIITPAIRATSTTAATPRQAQIVRFNGTTFAVLNSGPLPL